MGHMSRTPEAGWPVPPEVRDPSPRRQRRAWGKVSHEERYRRQRRDLLRAAGRLASRKGYEGTRVADIVAEAGLSKSTFYEHFDSKEECFVELYRRTSAGMLRAGVEAAEACDTSDPYGSILKVIRALIGYVSVDPRLANVIREELASAQPVIRSQRTENVRRIIGLFEALGRRLGTPLEDDELELTGTIVVTGVVNLIPELQRAPGGLEAQSERIARLCCRALGLRTPDS